MIIVRLLSIWILFWWLVAPATAAGDEAAPQALLSTGDLTITERDFQQDWLVLSEMERNQMLASPGALKGFLRDMYLSRRLAAEAERLGLDQRPEVQARLAAERRWTLAKVLRTHLEEQIKLPDFAALAREDYAAHRDKFQLPEQFEAAHILKKVRCDCERDEQRRKIEQLLSRLQAGEDFATLAKAESEDAGSAQNGGDLGWMKPEQFVAPFAAAMVKLSPGQLSGVVETEYGFHIIKLLDHHAARQQSFEDVQSSLEQSLRANYVSTQLSEQGARYLPGHDAKYNEAALEALLSKPH